MNLVEPGIAMEDRVESRTGRQTQGRGEGDRVKETGTGQILIALEKGLRDRDRGSWTEARAWTDGKRQEQRDNNGGTVTDRTGTG